MNKITKITAVLAVGLGMLLSPVTGSISKAEASHGWSWRGRHFRHGHFHKRVRFVGHGYNRFVYPRRVFVYDRGFVGGGGIVVSNAFTGPFSRNVNFVRLGLDHDDFVRVRRDIDISNEIDIDANTGGNIVRFNTIGGGFRTGDIDIDVDVDNRL